MNHLKISILRIKEDGMKRTLLAFAVYLTILLPAFHFSIAQQSDDIVFKAMKDELARTVEKLKMEDLQRPYYVEYVITEFQNLELDAAFGEITRKEDSRSRYFSIDLRVGDYSFDSTNFIGDWYGTRTPIERTVVDDNYEALRQDIWMATDRAYKDALERYARKRAYIQTKAITDLPSDLSKETPLVKIGPRVDLNIDKDDWEKTISALSSIFKEFPSIDDSELQFKAVAMNRYFLNSEGFKNRRGTFVILLEASASAQASDGQNIYDYESFSARNINDFPKEEKMATALRDLARKIVGLMDAEQPEAYVGPAIFTESASGEFFRQLLSANISSPQQPLFADERFSEMVQKSKLVGKLNFRVLPPFITAVDDPTIQDFNGMPLIGWFDVDDDGVAARKVSLVEDGKLVSLLMSRIPTRKIAQSNGHARGAVYIPPEGRQGNIIIASNEIMPYEDLKARLLDICRDMDLEYGIIIKKVRDKYFFLQSDPDTDLTPAQRKAELCSPVEVYKVYASDAREEPVRGMEFEGMTVRTLKDIMATADDVNVHNFMMGRNFEMPASIVSPSILIEEIELKKTEKKPSKPPILKSPLSDEYGSARQIQ